MILDRPRALAEVQEGRGVVEVDPLGELDLGPVGEADGERAAAPTGRDGRAEAEARLLPERGRVEGQVAAVVEAEDHRRPGRVERDRADAEEGVVDREVAPLVAEVELRLAGLADVLFDIRARRKPPNPSSATKGPPSPISSPSGRRFMPTK